MPHLVRTFQVTACPSCGSATIRAVKGDWSGGYRGKRYVVKDLRYFHENLPLDTPPLAAGRKAGHRTG